MNEENKGDIKVYVAYLLSNINHGPLVGAYQRLNLLRDRERKLFGATAGSVSAGKRTHR